MVNDIPRNEIANVIAFHDYDDKKVDVKGWFEYCVKLFEKNGLTPTRIGSPSKTHRKTINFSRGAKKFRERNFKDVDSMWFSCGIPTGGTDMFDFLAAAQLHLFYKENQIRDTSSITIDNGILPFSKDIFYKIVKDLCGFIQPKYGYCLQHRFTQGASFYPYGICSGDISEEESDDIAKWANEYKYEDGSYKTGDLRDIYSINILCPSHLDRQVGSQSLHDWICASPQNGELTPLTDELWFWWIEESEISRIREALKPHDLLVIYRED